VDTSSAVVSASVVLLLDVVDRVVDVVDRVIDVVDRVIDVVDRVIDVVDRVIDVVDRVVTNAVRGGNVGGKLILTMPILVLRTR